MICKIVGGLKHTVVGPKYCLRLYGYDLDPVTWEPISHILHSHIVSYNKRKKINISKETDWCITGVLSLPSSKKND